MKIKIAVLLAILVSGISCTEVVEIELDSTYKRLVVYGTITTDNVRHYVELTTTSDYFFNDEPPPVTGADVTIRAGDSLITLRESEIWPGIYQMEDSYAGQPGIRYTLTISNVDIDQDGETEIYSATATMPTLAKADSITLTKFITPFFSGYQVALWSPEPPGTNYYSYKLARNDELIQKRLSQFTVQPDDFFNDNYISGVPVGFLDDEDEDEFVVPGDKVTLVINSITEDYYNFVVDAQNEIFGNNPLFSGPPANVSSNIDGDAVGIFTAWAIDRVTATVPVPQIP